MIRTWVRRCLSYWNGHPSRPTCGLAGPPTMAGSSRSITLGASPRSMCWLPGPSLLSRSVAVAAVPLRPPASPMIRGRFACVCCRFVETSVSRDAAACAVCSGVGRAGSRPGSIPAAERSNRAETGCRRAKCRVDPAGCRRGSRSVAWAVGVEWMSPDGCHRSLSESGRRGRPTGDGAGRFHVPVSSQQVLPGDSLRADARRLQGALRPRRALSEPR